VGPDDSQLISVRALSAKKRKMKKKKKKKNAQAQELQS
jgi:hypothetical protein